MPSLGYYPALSLHTEGKRSLYVNRKGFMSKNYYFRVQTSKLSLQTLILISPYVFVKFDQIDIFLGRDFVNYSESSENYEETGFLAFYFGDGKFLHDLSCSFSPLAWNTVFWLQKLKFFGQDSMF